MIVAEQLRKTFPGPGFYGLEPNANTVTLERAAMTVPAELPYGDETIVPLAAGETLGWRQVQ